MYRIKRWNLKNKVPAVLGLDSDLNTDLRATGIDRCCEFEWVLFWSVLGSITPADRSRGHASQCGLCGGQ
jgi:hypothetical protein